MRKSNFSARKWKCSVASSATRWAPTGQLKHKAASDKSIQIQFIQIKSSFLTIIDPTVSQTLQNHNCSEKSKFNRQTNKLNRVLFLFS